MPLKVVERPDRRAEFLVFYSSRDSTGTMWCPDCQRVESALEATFPDTGGAKTAGIVYVGDKPTWKAPENEYRQAPWKVSSIPTIVKLRDEEEVSRLVEDDILDKEKMKRFLDA